MNSTRKAALIFLATFGLYFLTRSPALDEHDSVQLAMGVLDFNMWQDQPHAPGYPLFIFLGSLAHGLFGIGPELSLHLLSAAGGALFIALWFLIIQRQFSDRLAWWVAGCLTITPAVWMTATKALTDTLASALVSAEIFAALFVLQRKPHIDRPSRSMSRARSSEETRLGPVTESSTTPDDSATGDRAGLALTALLGAAAAGVRPQLILVAVAILATALKRIRADWRTSLLAFAALIVGCLLWLGPLSYSQWRLHPETPIWSVFPRLAYHQWAWRLDKPGVYLGAGDWSVRYLATRALFHFAGWFGLGFGFIKSPAAFLIGSVVVISSLTAYVRSLRSRNDGGFWRFHAPWAMTHVAVIFITLSPAQRYYLLIFPLLLLAMLRGLLSSPAPWNRTGLVLPLVLLWIGIPLAIDNHRNPPPALRLVRFVAELYPAHQRPHVVLLFNKVRRHAQWYAPQFVTVHDQSPAELAKLGTTAVAMYTDDARAVLPPGWRRLPLAIFIRSGVIYWKHHSVELYLIDRESH